MYKFNMKIYFILLTTIPVIFKNCWGEVVSLDNSNLDTIIKSNDLVFVNFYADWCRFSQMLAPVFADAAKQVKEKFPVAGKVVLAKVDCDRESNIAAAYQVSKYPTLKIFRYGEVEKREYRGQRSIEAFVNFVTEELSDSVKKLPTVDELDNLDWHKRHIIGYFDSYDSNDYKIYSKVSSLLKKDCNFVSVAGPGTEKDRVAGNKIVYRPNVEEYNEMVYTGLSNDYNMLLRWTQDKCIPLVREITFENAEELTEEGLPFLILFHHQDDTETTERFKKFVATDLLSERSQINFLIADGLKFVHPLMHMGKNEADLPIVAIDSFKHMYLWNRVAKKDIDTPGLLQKFISDMKSGKLHREFHQGPDPVDSSQGDDSSKSKEEKMDGAEHIPHDQPTDRDSGFKQADETSAPPSVFNKLKPSRTRYTIIKEEL